MTHKMVFEMTYNLSSGTLNLTIPLSVLWVLNTGGVWKIFIFFMLNYARAWPRHRWYVSLSVTHWYRVRINDRRIVDISPSCSPGTLFFETVKPLVTGTPNHNPNLGKTPHKHASVLTQYSTNNISVLFLAMTHDDTAVYHRPAATSVVFCASCLHK